MPFSAPITAWRCPKGHLTLTDPQPDPPPVCEAPQATSTVKTYRACGASPLTPQPLRRSG